MPTLHASAPATRCFGFSLLLALAVAPLAAQPATATATAAAGWSFTGPSPLDGPAAGAVTLPAGAELLRTVTGDLVSLRLLSQPFFSPQSSGSPSLEIGPVGLSFFRNADGGAMVLLGDQTLQLPAKVVLGTDGRSRHPLDLTLWFDRGHQTGSLAVADTTYTVAATAPAGPINIAVAAGGEMPWPISALQAVSDGLPAEETLPTSLDQASARGSGKISNGSADKKPGPEPSRADLRRSGVAEAKAKFVAGDDAAAEQVMSDLNFNPKGTAEWHLETANDLILLAFSFTRDGQPKQAGALARLALQHLEQVAEKSKQPVLTAASEAASALIYEQLLADPATAKALYRAAAERYPAGGAGREAQRLEKIEQEANRKPKGR
jgi:hypothetical protein